MPRSSNKRERLVRSADRLILRQGFRQTTLSDIAEDSGVPLGNVYYYFKTKEDIGKTVVDARIEAMRALLEQCSDHADPRRRLLDFLDYPLTLRDELASNGCPLGTLSYELSRLDGQLARSSPELIRVVLDWARRQFDAMGRPDGEALALEFVTRLQGLSLVANALQDPTVVDSTVDRLRAWLAAL